MLTKKTEIIKQKNLIINPVKVYQKHKYEFML